MSVFCEVFAGEANELQLLCAVDGLIPFTGGEALPRFHLDEDQHPSAPYDEIDLPAVESLIAADDRVSAQAIKPGSPPLAAAAERSRIHASEIN